ncbi:MAG: CinA family nicotinamide mononucleotide deamidase-related protein [Actinomycetota bacterium]|nr:CinA family nicotinamide mononucleotide deamidase-related protein [Actinomycetota bacterium]
MGRPEAVIVVTGSELVRGARRDENGRFLAADLTRLGLEPARWLVVGDRPDELAMAIREGLDADLAVISGGLGPTHDDRTIELLAAAAGRPLVVDESLEREIEAASRRGAEALRRPYADFAPGVRKQASLPVGAVSLGLAGTAPAVLLEHGDGRVAVALPGPPNELRRLWPRAREHEALRRLLSCAPRRAHRLLRLFGPSESAVARALDEAGGEAESVEVTVCAHDLEIHVDLFVDEAGSAAGERLERALRDRFGSALFAGDDATVEEIVLALCRERGLALATAESCTGGLVGARLTSVPGASDVYVGGVVAYADEAKARILHIPADVLARAGAVSAETAGAMARGARHALGADVALSVTGIAGPGGGTREKPVGLVFLHAASHVQEATLSLQLPGDREAIRRRAAVAALHLVRRLLTQTAQVPRQPGG